MLTAELGPRAIGLFTTRAGGCSTGSYAGLNLGVGVHDRIEDVAANRAHLDRTIGTPTAYLRQVHSADLLIDPDVAILGAEPVADAVVLQTAKRAAAVLVADCVPVLLASVEGPVAAIHAGRRGILTGIIAGVAAAMSALGAPPGYAAIGPCICAGCYEVPEVMRVESAQVHPALAAETRWGTPSLDLRAGVAAQLEAVGVHAIDQHRICTREDAEFYSFRRDGLTGRFAGVVRRRSALDEG